MLRFCHHPSLIARKKEKEREREREREREGEKGAQRNYRNQSPPPPTISYLAKKYF